MSAQDLGAGPLFIEASLINKEIYPNSILELQAMFDISVVFISPTISIFVLNIITMEFVYHLMMFTTSPITHS
jgi:hypothetical protein